VARQLPVGPSRDLAVVLHDIAFLLPRTIDLEAEIGLEPLPTSELEVIRLLVRQPGLSVGEVAQELELQPSNASSAVRSLVSRGLLARRPDERDGRISRLSPTPRAQAIRRQREAAWGQLLRTRLSRLEREEAAQLLSAVEALRALAMNLAAGE
jgi:DNA-binding MarR family transcriptional regulator